TFADRMETLADAAIVLPTLAYCLEPRTSFHVRAGREDLARAGEDGHAHLFAVAQGVEDIGQLGVELGVLCVDRRVVHCHHRYGIGDGDLDECDVPLASPEKLAKHATIAETGSRFCRLWLDHLCEPMRARHHRGGLGPRMGPRARLGPSVAGARLPRVGSKGGGAAAPQRGSLW